MTRRPFTGTAVAWSAKGVETPKLQQKSPIGGAFCYTPISKLSFPKNLGLSPPPPLITVLISQFFTQVSSGVTLPFGAPLLIFCRPHKFFTVSKKKKKKKVATFFSVFLIGFLHPWSFLYPQIFFSRRPNAKLAEIWYILLLYQKIFR